MLAFRLSTVGGAIIVVASVHAIDLASITLPADEKGHPAIIHNALNLPKIVHPRARPPGIRPPQAIRATRPKSNASPAATQGSELDPPGPFFLAAAQQIVTNAASHGQLRG